LAPGESGNLPSNRLVAVEGELGLNLAVTNPYPTHGGRNAPSPAPSQADRSRLYDRLTTALQETALSDLELKLPEGGFLISNTLQISEVLEESYFPTEGLPGDTLDLTLRLEYQAMYIPRDTLLSLLLPVLDGSLPEGYIPLPNSLTISHSTPEVTSDEGVVSWTISTTRQIKAVINPAEVIQLASGQSPATIRHRLAALLPMQKLPELTLYPSWWPRLPFLSFRIEVITP
jgi:hypothetical protein